MPWPPNSVDAEDGVGFYRNFDGFIVTCGLNDIGGVRRGDADRYIHKHRKQVFNPLHGRISSQRAALSGYGIDWSTDVPVIWAEGVVRQSAVFGENLVLRRRIEVEVFGDTIRIDDVVENRGFRPTPHASLYHVNFGYPFLDESTSSQATWAVTSSRRLTSRTSVLQTTSSTISGDACLFRSADSIGRTVQPRSIGRNTSPAVVSTQSAAKFWNLESLSIRCLRPRTGANAAV